jgi:hypothetical protein
LVIRLPECLIKKGASYSDGLVAVSGLTCLVAGLGPDVDEMVEGSSSGEDSGNRHSTGARFKRQY